MQRLTVHSGVFCLIRTLPLLDVLDSPIKGAVESIIEGSLSGTPIPDSVLMLLDDYREARGELEDIFTPVYLQSGVASAAILVSEAQWPRYYPKPAPADLEVETVWQVFDECLARTRGVSALSLSNSAFAQEERSWQEADKQAISRSETDPLALAQHLDQMRSMFAATRLALAELVAEFGWTPSGPCGDGCDWPSCKFETSRCVSHRRFQQTLAGELRRRQGAQPETWYMLAGCPSHARDEPYESLSEISAEGYELRKVAYYGDDHAEWVDASGGSGRLALSRKPVPPFVELSSRDDIWVEEITSQHFERRWAEARENPQRPFIMG